MDGFEKRKEQKKDSIRKAALELFRSYGFRKVSVAEIARKAGVSQVTIYNYFGNKHELVRDVMKWFILSLIERYETMMSGDAPFLEKLEAIVFDKAEVVTQFQGELVQTILQEDMELRDFLAKAQQERILPAVAAFLHEGSRLNYVNSRFSLPGILLYFEILRRGFFDLPDFSERVQKNPGLIKEIIELVTYGLNG